MIDVYRFDGEVGMSSPIELFRCDPLKARISEKQCGANYRAANGYQVLGHASRRIGLGPCVRCDVGKSNAKGWRDPRVKQSIFGSYEHRKEKAMEMLEDRKTPIATVGRMVGISYHALQKHLKRHGFDTKEWPPAKSHAVSRSEASRGS